MRTSARWARGALLLTGVLLLGFTVQWLRERPQPESTDAKERAASTSPSRTHNLSRPATNSSAAGQRVPSERADETPPWQVPAQDTATLPPGTVPTWRIDAPPPDPSAPLPAPPAPAPNPAEHRPPLHDPGALDRDRPQRG